MPTFNDYPRALGTVIHIGSDWTNDIHTDQNSYRMPAQKISKRYESSTSTSRWSSNGEDLPSSRPISRYDERADSAASNVSLKDKIDVFVEDKFLKSYNIQYEPVRIQIGNDEPGNTYQSKILPTSYGNPTSLDYGSNNSSYNGTPGNTRIRSSYHENTKTTTTTEGQPPYYPSRNENSASVISIGSPDSGRNSRSNGTGYSTYNSPTYTPFGREYNVPIARENGYFQTNGGATTIPISRDADTPYYQSNGGRQSTFSPDSGRDSVELPFSRGYEPTPLPATPLGRQSSVTISQSSNEKENQPYDIKPWSERSRTPDNRIQPETRRQRSTEFSNSPTPEPVVRPSVHFDENPSFHSARINEPITTNFSVQGGTDKQRTRQSRSPNQPHSTYIRRPESANRSSTESPDFQRSTPLGGMQEFRVNQDDLLRGGPTPPPLPVSLFQQKPETSGVLVNAPSLTYATESRNSSDSPIPTNDRHRSTSRNRSLSRGGSLQRPSSRAGLPSYDRDYVDRSEDDSDLDDLADAERNERLRQKKLIFPQNRNAALMAELKETTNNISASRRSRKEEEFTRKLEKKDNSGILDRFTAEQFIPLVPYYDEEGFAIAEYKRNFLAKQAANQARRDFQARINAGERVEDIIQSPELKKIFIDQAKEEYDGTPFKLGAKESLQINLLNKGHSSKQPWQLELLKQ